MIWYIKVDQRAIRVKRVELKSRKKVAFEESVSGFAAQLIQSSVCIIFLKVS